MSNPNPARTVTPPSTPPFPPPKDKTLLEQAEDLLDRARKELQAQREKIAYLELIEQEHSYLKRVIDMHLSVVERRASYGEAGVQPTEFEIADFIKMAQEAKLNGILTP